MDWKTAIKKLKEFHAAGADGSPASMQAELSGLEESLKGWEERDEHREKSFQAWKAVDAKLRAERDHLLKQLPTNTNEHREYLIGLTKERDDTLLQNDELAKALKASTEDLTRLADHLESNRTALNNVTEMYGEAHRVLEVVKETLDTEIGCDCGTDEPGSCALCQVKEALKPTPTLKPIGASLTAQQIGAPMVNLGLPTVRLHPYTCGECRAVIRTDVCPACALKREVPQHKCVNGNDHQWGWPVGTSSASAMVCRFCGSARQ